MGARFTRKVITKCRVRFQNGNCRLVARVRGRQARKVWKCGRDFSRGRMPAAGSDGGVLIFSVGSRRQSSLCVSGGFSIVMWRTCKSTFVDTANEGSRGADPKRESAVGISVDTSFAMRSECGRRQFRFGTSPTLVDETSQVLLISCIRRNLRDRALRIDELRSGESRCGIHETLVHCRGGGRNRIDSVGSLSAGPGTDRRERSRRQPTSFPVRLNRSWIGRGQYNGQTA